MKRDWKTQRSLRFGLWISFLLLAGCGGGSGSGTADSQVLTAGINLVIFESERAGTSALETAIDQGERIKVTVKLLDDRTLPISREVLTATVDVGTISSPPSLTDQNGLTTFYIEAPTDLTTETAVGVLTVSAVGYADRTFSYEFKQTATVSTGTDTGESTGVSIAFVSAEPNYIGLKGVGGLDLAQQSVVTFVVKDVDGNPVYNQLVNFKLATAIGGLTLSATESYTDLNGQVTTRVLSGSVPTSVRVIAYFSVNGVEISAPSDQLTIGTGLPDQNSFEITADKLAPQGLHYSGEVVNITARLADRNNNPVPDGTSVYFTTEGGVIDSSCETVKGVCSVEWRSQTPRPADHRVTVQAYAIGNESFYDRQNTADPSNGQDGVFDGVDVFDDLAEAFRDDDENGVYNPSATAGFINDFALDERYQDYNSDGVYSVADGLFNGVPCQHDTKCAASPGLADVTTTLVHIRASKVLIMAANYPKIHLYQLNSGTSCLGSNGKISTVNCTNVANTSVNFTAGVQTLRFWAMVEDTAAKCQATANDATRVDAIDPDSAACLVAVRQSAATGSTIAVTSEVGTLSGVPETGIANTLGHREFVLSVTSDDTNTRSTSGPLEIKVTAPKGEIQSISTTLIDPIN